MNKEIMLVFISSSMHHKFTIRRWIEKYTWLCRAGQKCKLHFVKDRPLFRDSSRYGATLKQFRYIILKTSLLENDKKNKENQHPMVPKNSNTTCYRVTKSMSVLEKMIKSQHIESTSWSSYLQDIYFQRTFSNFQKVLVALSWTHCQNYVSLRNVINFNLNQNFELKHRNK